MAGSSEKHPHRLIEKRCIYDAFFRINEFLFLKNSDESRFKRFVVHRPDATAILLYNNVNDTILLVKQLRAPAFGREEDPYLLELPAGIVEAGEEPRSTIIREAREETGYSISEPRFINAFYASPGTFSEKIHIYFAEVTPEDQTHKGGGLAEEMEELELKAYDRQTTFQMLDEGQIKDAKSQVALWWFRVHQAR